MRPNVHLQPENTKDSAGWQYAAVKWLKQEIWANAHETRESL